jgi:hypothetical protein
MRTAFSFMFIFKVIGSVASSCLRCEKQLVGVRTRSAPNPTRPLSTKDSDLLHCLFLGEVLQTGIGGDFDA